MGYPRTFQTRHALLDCQLVDSLGTSWGLDPHHLRPGRYFALGVGVDLSQAFQFAP